MKRPSMIYLNARAIIEKIANGERMVLIQQRGDTKYFEFPGGYVEMGESIIDALKREVLEETGLTVTKIHGIESYAHFKSVEAVKPFQYIKIYKAGLIPLANGLSQSAYISNAKPTANCLQKATTQRRFNGRHRKS